MSGEKTSDVLESLSEGIESSVRVLGTIVNMDSIYTCSKTYVSFK